jgi:hypothetical protein
MKDLVIGAVSNYNFDQIKPWINSLEQSGFDGYKMLVCYNIDSDTSDALARRNIILGGLHVDDLGTFSADPAMSIVVNRFLHYWIFLRQLAPEMKKDIRYVIATDVKDVIFQRNPSEYFDKWKDQGESPSVVAASESMRYRDEEWGVNNLVSSFTVPVASSLFDAPIYNCGSFAAKFETAIGLFLSIYLLSNGTTHHQPGGGGPDQAALNILLNTEAYHRHFYGATSEDGWAAQLGTTMDPRKIDAYRSSLLEPAPIILNDQVCTSHGTPHYLVHQYDRVPALKALFEAKYGA